MSNPPMKCDVCGKAEGVELKRCGKCRSRVFCSVECQRQNWPDHKLICKAKVAGKIWYEELRTCDDGSQHFGELELITWEGEEEGEKMGWGRVTVEEAADHKRKYEEEFQSDDGKMFEYWPQAYRWTCCGTTADMKWGCDHHGSGPRPCECDFCHMGKKIPDATWNKNKPKPECQGLELQRGPDPRSFNPKKAEIDAQMRRVMGLD